MTKITAFQRNAFQNNAFQIQDVGAVITKVRDKGKVLPFSPIPKAKVRWNGGAEKETKRLVSEIKKFSPALAAQVEKIFAEKTFFVPGFRPSSPEIDGDELLSFLEALLYKRAGRKKAKTQNHNQAIIRLIMMEDD